MKDTISCSGFFFVDTAEIIAREQTFQNLCELVRGTHYSKSGNFRGEPLAWAKTDSLPQRLSVFSQTRLAGFKQWVAERAAGDYDAAAADRRLDETIAGAPVVLFSFTSCPFCRRAKELLSAKGAAYRVLELDEAADGAALRAQLGRRTGRTSVPIAVTWPRAALGIGVHPRVHSRLY